MAWNPGLKSIETLLAEIYLQEEDVQRILDEAQIPNSSISFGPASQNTWHDILRKANVRNELPTLFQICIKDSRSQDLKDACEAYFKNVKNSPGSDISKIGGIAPVVHEFYSIFRHKAMIAEYSVEGRL